MSQEEREELIFICSLMTHYSEEFLSKLSDEELNKIYNKSMGISLEKGK